MRILVFGCTHLYWDRKGFLPFCSDLRDEYDCDTIIHLGDVVDQHAISFHNKEPGCPGPMDEYYKTLEAVQRWVKEFPKVIVTLGNHDKRVVRRAKSVDIPEEIYLKPYKEVWQTPGWEWVEDIILDDIYLYHGDGQGGEYPACNAVRKMLMSVCIAHNHSKAMVKPMFNPRKGIWAIDAGAGCDDTALNMIYAERNKRRSVMSAVAIIDGHPYLETMPCGFGQKYHDSNF